MERQRYAALESTVLLHHAYESLLRLYLALAFDDPCPWLAMVNLREPGAFVKAARGLRDDLRREERIDDLLRVAIYATERDDFNPAISLAVWNGNRAALVALFRDAISTVLGDGNYYNSAKHGLAILAGEHGFRIAPAGGGVSTSPVQR